MRKPTALLILLAIAAWATAQTDVSRSLSLSEPVRLTYETTMPTIKLASLDPWKYQLPTRSYLRRAPTIDLYFNSRNDPFRTWNHRRVGFREVFGSEARGNNWGFEWSTGETDKGRMSYGGFEIRW